MNAYLVCMTLTFGGSLFSSPENPEATIQSLRQSESLYGQIGYEAVCTDSWSEFALTDNEGNILSVSDTPRVVVTRQTKVCRLGDLAFRESLFMQEDEDGIRRRKYQSIRVPGAQATSDIYPHHLSVVNVVHSEFFLALDDEQSFGERADFRWNATAIDPIAFATFPDYTSRSVAEMVERASERGSVLAADPVPEGWYSRLLFLDAQGGPIASLRLSQTDLPVVEELLRFDRNEQPSMKLEISYQREDAESLPPIPVAIKRTLYRPGTGEVLQELTTKLLQLQTITTWPSGYGFGQLHFAAAPSKLLYFEDEGVEPVDPVPAVMERGILFAVLDGESVPVFDFQVLDFPNGVLR